MWKIFDILHLRINWKPYFYTFSMSSYVSGGRNRFFILAAILRSNLPLLSCTLELMWCNFIGWFKSALVNPVCSQVSILVMVSVVVFEGKRRCLTWVSYHVPSMLLTLWIIIISAAYYFTCILPCSYIVHTILHLVHTFLQFIYFVYISLSHSSERLFYSILFVLFWLEQAWPILEDLKEQIIIPSWKELLRT